MKKINQVKIGNTSFNLDEKMSKTHFKKCFRGKLEIDLDKAWKIIQEEKRRSKKSQYIFMGFFRILKHGL